MTWQSPENTWVIINNYNRLAPLLRLIDWLSSAGFSRIVVLDNGSDYPPLLEYYETCRHEVVRGPNLGPYALWRHRELWRRVRSNFYIYTDADLVPDEQCPLDVVEHLRRRLRWRLLTPKIGLGLRIDDLPDCFEKKTEVVQWEAKFWRCRACADCFRAPVDTTFALYRPFARGWARYALRTDFPYVARHLPWYEDSRNPSEEERYYAKTARRGASTWLESSGTVSILFDAGTVG